MPPIAQPTSFRRIVAIVFVSVWTAGLFAGLAAAADQPAAVRLVSLDNGDSACYLNIRTTAGSRSLPGDFDLCPGGAKDASKLVGKLVEYTTKKTKVMAASCAGAENCRKTSLVDLVVALKAAAASPASAQPPVPVHIPAPGR